MIKLGLSIDDISDASASSSGAAADDLPPLEDAAAGDAPQSAMEEVD